MLNQLHSWQNLQVISLRLISTLGFMTKLSQMLSGQLCNQESQHQRLTGIGMIQTTNQHLNLLQSFTLLKISDQLFTKKGTGIGQDTLTMSMMRIHLAFISLMTSITILPFLLDHHPLGHHQLQQDKWDGALRLTHG